MNTSHSEYLVQQPDGKKAGRPSDTAFLVARGLRILQEFAGICRWKCWIFFVFTVGGLTYNP
jgi:hypothetical protein